MKNGQIKRNLIAGLVFGAIICVLMLVLEKEQPLMHRLCDGCFVAAVALLGSAGLAFARNQGQFDIIGFGVASVVHTRWSFTQAPTLEKESFADYKERKKKERKSPLGTLLAGCPFLVLAFVFLIVYSSQA